MICFSFQYPKRYWEISRCGRFEAKLPKICQNCFLTLNDTKSTLVRFIWKLAPRRGGGGGEFLNKQRCSENEMSKSLIQASQEDWPMALHIRWFLLQPFIYNTFLQYEIAWLGIQQVHCKNFNVILLAIQLYKKQLILKNVLLLRRTLSYPNYISLSNFQELKNAI